MLSINNINSYNTKTSLISSIYGTSKSASSYSSIMSAISNSYGVNTSKTSSSLSSYLVGIKEAAKDITSAVSTGTKASTWNDVSYNSDSSAVSVNYTGSEKLEDMKVDVKAVAKEQKNEGKSLTSDDKTNVRSTSFSIEASDGKSKSFYVASNSSLTNEELQQKVADKINSAKLGITATVEKNSKDGTSKLVLSGKTGKDNTFSVSGSLAEDLGINKTTQNAQNASYSINSGEYKESDINDIKLNDKLSLTLKAETEKTANITYSKKQTKGINAARELVNSYNALYDTAKGYDDLGSLKLQSKLVGLDSTYSGALSRVGITTNSEGYLQIDEDKMQKAAEDGTLEKFFREDSGQSYGFVNRLNQLADKIDSDPSRYASSSAKEELSSNASYTDFSVDYLKSSRYIKSYFNYVSTSALFDALF